MIVVRGINYNVQNPTDVDTFVKIEFPFPAVSYNASLINTKHKKNTCTLFTAISLSQGSNIQDRTEVVRDTNNPVYEHKTVFSIDRKTRALGRVFKRHNVKLTVHAKG